MSEPELKTVAADLTPERERELVSQFRGLRERINTELSKVIIGQKDVVEQLLISLLSGGHCLITGAPGLAKTLLVDSIAQLFDLKFNRIQFTPDLMPADITGTEVLEEDGAGHRAMRFIPGPIFANVLLADEINRTPPKTQSALLEAMQEHQVTAAGLTHQLKEPFFVLATQNPIEMEGTYPLPEAQLDRFMFNVLIDYLPEDDEVAVVQQTTSKRRQKLQSLFEGSVITELNQVVQRVPIAEEVVRYAVRLAVASRPREKNSPEFVNDLISWGAGLRAGQNMVLGGKARALLDGRPYVSTADIQALAKPVMRHRILPNYRAEAEGITTETIVDRLLQHVEHPKQEAVA
ncbi:MAG: AAA domain-containing protein [Fuerstiella sp.]|jgi:MoxR-like ATPase|nr:AAA domain-containing protein [Fuerstiella sp.]MCP4513192.1 AAA domain-containing protein [Fuerstiella sp.]MDG2128978.1 AAA family ATPase [Fuerstiella sp.]